MHILLVERHISLVLEEAEELLAEIEPLQRQGRIKRPSVGSSPSKQILHCLSPLV